MEEQGIPPQTDTESSSVAARGTHEVAHPHASKRVVWGIVALCGMIALVGIWSQWGEEIKDACTGGGDTGACVVEFDESPPSVDDVRFEAFDQGPSVR